MDDLAISLQGLSHAYEPRHPVLEDLNLGVERGQMVAIIGLSGAGKSTLLRCLNGLISPQSGSVKVLGQEVTRMGGHDQLLLRRRIGMIFQEFNLVDRLSTLKNVLIGRLGYTRTLRSCFHLFASRDVDLARSCLADVGLSGLEHRRVRELSGGQKQRVAIARCMAQQAEIILADEATANLDVLTKEEIMDLLQALCRDRGTTVVLSMHDVQLARAYCPRIVGLKEGRITFDSSPDNLDEAAVAEILHRAA